MNNNKPLSSQRTGHHNGGGGGGGGRPYVTRNGSFQKRRFGGGADTNPRGGSNTTNTRDREWVDRRDHRGGGINQGGINNRGVHQGGGSGGGDGRGGFGRHDTGGRGGDRGSGSRGDRMTDARGGPQSQQHLTQERGRDFGRGQHAPQPRGPPTPTPEDIERAKIPIPPHERRTLVLTNVPSHLKFYHVQHHFLNNFSAYVQYALMDREAGDAYIRFKHVADAKRVWQKGSEGLDGSPPQQTGGKAYIGSWVELGIKLKAVHFTNFMVDSRYLVDKRSGDRDQRSMDRDQRSMDRDQRGFDRNQRSMDRNQRSIDRAPSHTNNSPRMCGAGGGGGRGQHGGGRTENHHRKRNWSEDRDNGRSQHQRAQHSQRVQHSHPPPPPPPSSKNNLRSPSKMPRYSAPEERDYAQAHAETDAPGNYSGQYYSQSRKQSFDRTAKTEPPYHANNSPPNSRSGNYNNKDHYYDPQQQQQPYYNTPQPSDSAALAPAHPPSSTNPSNNSYHRSPMKPSCGHPKHSAMELQQEPQYTEEEQQQWEASQQQEAAWRARRQAEYDQFLARKNDRLSHISTLEQKRDLLVQQEGMLTKQLPLHKKMLAVLQAKKAPATEQSKKMKEILSAQTRIMELKKEMKHLVEEIEREREAAEEVFRPSERRTGGNEVADRDGGVGKNRSIDRRTTILKVEGLYQEVTEDAVKEHFSMFGTVSSVRLVMPNELLESGDCEPASSFALVNFVNRSDAESAMTSDIKFEDNSLTCTWHNSTLSSSHTDRNDGDSKSMDHSAAADDANGDDDLYDDVGGVNYNCNELEEDKTPASPEKVYGNNEEEDYLVDYDLED